MTKRRELCLVEFYGQAVASEPVEQVIREQDKFSIGAIGKEEASWDFGQREIVLQLFNNLFDARSFLVKAPHVVWLQIKIGYQDAVRIPIDWKKSKLVILLLVEATAHNNEAILLRPLMRLIIERSRLPLRVDAMVAKTGELFTDGSGDPGNDGIADGPIFKKFNEFRAIEASISAQSNLFDGGRNTMKALREKGNGFLG